MPTIDQSTGQTIQSPVEGQWHIIPAPDGHSHSFAGVVKKKPEEKDPEPDNEIAIKIQKLFKEARDYEFDFRKDARSCERFYEGDQWDKSIRDDLVRQNRAALTINEIEPKIDLLSGYQRQNRSDIRYFPVEDGDQHIADILTTVVKVINEDNGYDEEENEVFLDEMVAGRGLFNLRVDFDDDIRGKIVIEKYPWADCWFGPHLRKDLKDCEYLIKGKWFSYARVKKTWPDKADDIQRDIAMREDGMDPERVYRDEPYEHPDKILNTPSNHEIFDIARKEYRVLECWHKDYERVFAFINPKKHILFNAEDWAKDDVAAVKTMEGFHILPRVKTEMTITKVAGNVLLSKTKDKFFDGNFGIVPSYSKKHGKKVWGKVHAAKDPQIEINKRHSQSVDIMNKVASYGWFYEQTTFSTQTEANKFKRNSSSPGFHAKLTDITRPPVQVAGVKFPKEIVALETLATDKINSIMNINPELQGQSQRKESGVAIAEKKRQGLIGNEFLFDNLAIAKKGIGKKFVQLIQHIYTPMRILRILQTSHKKKPLTLGGQNFDEIDPQDILELLFNSDLTKYDVAVGESAASPTTKHANFATWAELSKTHPETIPLEILIDLSDLPEKDKVKAKIAERAQQIAAEAEKTRQAEVGKPIILGRCRRHAPSMNGYPVVYLDDWCGDHKIDENKL